MPNQFWGQIELMGHRSHIGLITEVTFAGAQMLMVQVPHPEKQTDSTGAEQFAETHRYSPSSLYGLHEVTESEVRTRLARLATGYYSRTLPAHDQEHDTEIDNRLSDTGETVVDAAFDDDGGTLY